MAERIGPSSEELLGISCRRCGRGPGPLEHGHRVQELEAERDRLRAALEVAADDLYKAANQFAGLRSSPGTPVVTNPEKFVEKADRARAALSASPPEPGDAR